MHWSKHSKYHGVGFKNHPKILLLLLFFRNRTKETDVSDIEQTLKDTSKLHDKIKEKLNEAKDNKNITSTLLDQVNIWLTPSL